MYIKSITLRGFLCYKDTTTITLDPKFNVIIGPNGSGKSSLLAGIRFVMGESTAMDKERYLHRGASSRVLVGYVSAVLDNSDGRLTGFDGAEVILQRDIGQKKDELTLNKKKITKQELQSLLESAGFSRSNPYYFVQQHEVNALTRMSNADRLGLLKEVAGTRLYDERRTEAARSLEETRNRRILINNTLDVIISRMNELREEQEELKEFHELEKERRCIESLLSSKELGEITEVIQTMRETQLQKTVKLTDYRVELDMTNESVEGLEMDYQKEEEELNRLTKQQKDLRTKMCEVEGENTRLALMVESRRGEAAKRNKEKKAKINELNKLEAESRKIADDVRLLGPKKVSAGSVAKEKEMNLHRARQELSQLQSRSSLKEQFASIGERNKTLSEVIKKKEDELKTLAKQKNESIQQLRDIESLISRHAGSSTELKTELENSEIELRSLTQRGSITTQEMFELSGRMTELQQRDQQLKEIYRQQENELYHATQRLHRTMRPEQCSAIDAALGWAVATGNQSVVYGTLLENIRVHPDYHVAVETASGTQLFNLLVMNRRVAIDIINHIKSRREGSAIITPLQDIETLHETLLGLPNANDTRVKRLLDVVDCDAHIMPAVKQVFGRFLLVEDRDVGNQYYSSGFDCITMDGDIISRKGILQGGYVGHQKRMKSQAQIVAARNVLQQTRVEGGGIEKQLFEIEERMREIKKLQFDADLEKERNKVKRIELKEKMQELEKDGIKNEHRKARFENQLAESKCQAELIKEDIQRIRREVASTLGGLTSEESKKQRDLASSMASMEAAYEKAQQVHDALVHQLDDKEFQLNDVLKPHLERLREVLAQLSDEEPYEDEGIMTMPVDEELSVTIKKQEQLSNQLKTLKSDLLQTENLRSLTQSAVTSLHDKLGHLKRKQEKLKRKRDELTTEIQSAQTQLEAQLTIRDEMSGKQQVMAGTSELLKDLSQLSNHELTKTLATVAKKLRTFDDVNRKASDQYSSFIDEQTQLTTQRELLYKEEDSVLELMASLDSQKDATLHKTFENVNMRFKQVFSEIVAGGTAKLGLKRRQRQEGDAAYGQDEPPPSDILTEVLVKVQFPSFKGFIPLESLSGGQKSVTALALIFALQRVESAPFYVLDEVDASLDTQYRGALAKLIHRQSEFNQIIVISHKAETVSLANYFLKTCIINQTTTVTPTTVTDALQISQRIAIENQENDNSAQGGRKILPGVLPIRG